MRRIFFSFYDFFVLVSYFFRCVKKCKFSIFGKMSFFRDRTQDFDKAIFEVLLLTNLVKDAQKYICCKNPVFAVAKTLSIFLWLSGPGGSVGWLPAEIPEVRGSNPDGVEFLSPNFLGVHHPLCGGALLLSTP